MQVKCESPRIILNPKAPELLLRFKHYVLNGREYYKKRYSCHMSDFRYSDFSPRRNNITLDNIESSYVIDDASGQIFMLYLAVPCGHCSICKKSKINSFVKRCEYESQMYNSMPWFGTLTYRYEPVDGVSVRDVQLFLKRFRINLKRAGYNFKIRYVIVGEYGKNTHRAHYHFVFWGIDSFHNSSYREIENLLNISWHQGFIRSRLVDLKDDKGFFYTAKYLKKDCYVPEGKNSTFVLSSRGSGGIGSSFIDREAPKIRKSLNVDYKYRNKWNGKVESIMWCSYVLNRVFPSFCRSVKHEFRNDVHDFIYYFKQHERFLVFMGRDLVEFFSSLYVRLSKWMFLPRDFDTSPITHGVFDVSYLENLKTRIEYGISFIDFSLANKLSSLRSRFLGKLFLHESKFDLVVETHKAKDFLSWESPWTLYF